MLEKFINNAIDILFAVMLVVFGYSIFTGGDEVNVWAFVVGAVILAGAAKLLKIILVPFGRIFDGTVAKKADDIEQGNK